MALPSQTERQTEIGRSYVYGQRTGVASGTRLALITAAVLIVAAGCVWGLLTVVNRRSSTGTLPPEAGKAESSRSSPAVKPVASNTTPATTTTPTLTAAGGTNPTALRTDAPITPPTGTLSSQTPAPAGSQQAAPATTPPSDATGRPTAVDVTRRDLTPAGEAGRTPTGSPTSSPNGTSASPTTSGEQTPTLAPSGSTSAVMLQVQAAEQRAAAGELLQARALFNKALRNPDAVRDDQDRIRQRLAAINADLLFSPKVFPGDTMAETYVVKSGDNLIKITRNRELAVDWRLIERINGVKGNTLKVGQKLKLVRGPFHAIVHKGEYRLDLFQGSPDDPDSWTFIRSFKVGLGTGNSTPLGTFVVRPKSKLVNPHWVNPQTGQKFHADDPKNPIGEYWMGLEGTGDSKTVTGYGLHGTIEPDSIGQQKSMGCVRLGDEDIKLLYEMLVEQISDVKIVP